MRTLFYILVLLTASTRLIELGISKRHRRQLLMRGASEVSDPGFVLMVAVHVGILVGSILEVALFDRGAPLWLAVVSSVGVVSASALRVWAIVSLGPHWNVRVVDSTSLGIVTNGPYRFIRHPNYVAVFTELLFLPLVHGAWTTALIGTVMHIVVLRRRISLEEAALMRDERYRRVMAGKPRFVPAI